MVTSAGTKLSAGIYGRIRSSLTATGPGIVALVAFLELRRKRLYFTNTDSGLTTFGP